MFKFGASASSTNMPQQSTATSGSGLGIGGGGGIGVGGGLPPPMFKFGTPSQGAGGGGGGVGVGLGGTSVSPGDMMEQPSEMATPQQLQQNLQQPPPMFNFGKQPTIGFPGIMGGGIGGGLQSVSQTQTQKQQQLSSSTTGAAASFVFGAGASGGSATAPGPAQLTAQTSAVPSFNFGGGGGGGGGSSLSGALGPGSTLFGQVAGSSGTSLHQQNQSSGAVMGAGATGSGLFSAGGSGLLPQQPPHQQGGLSMAFPVSHQQQLQQGGMAGAAPSSLSNPSALAPSGSANVPGFNFSGSQAMSFNFGSSSSSNSAGQPQMPAFTAGSGSSIATAKGKRVIKQARRRKPAS